MNAKMKSISPLGNGRWVSPAEAAMLAKNGTSGQLSAGKIGKTWRIEAGDLSTYFKSRLRKQLKKAS